MPLPPDDGTPLVEERFQVDHGDDGVDEEAEKVRQGGVRDTVG